MKTPGTDHGNTAEREKKTVHHAKRHWAVFFLISLPLLFSAWIYIYADAPGPMRDGMALTIIIPRRIGLERIENILIKNAVLHDDIRFGLLARITGKAHILKAGEYSFPPGLTPSQVLTLLTEGKIVQHPITIPEGTELIKIADILAADDWIDREKFLQLTRRPEFIKDLGLSIDSLEGYLFPDTYNLSRGNQNEAGIIRMMVEKFLETYREISHVEKPQTLSRHEIVTLASIVEKETALNEERPLIARVFLNRLQQGMRLQADPTVLYNRPAASGSLTKRDLMTPTPYNTYLIPGLPRGPICSPGRASLEAVLHPTEEDFLYFVSRNNGSHYFSKTLAEHNRAVAKYQR
jgi:UPF0755 protein